MEELWLPGAGGAGAGGGSCCLTGIEFQILEIKKVLEISRTTM